MPIEDVPVDDLPTPNNSLTEYCCPLEPSGALDKLVGSRDLITVEGLLLRVIQTIWSNQLLLRHKSKAWDPTNAKAGHPYINIDTERTPANDERHNAIYVGVDKLVNDDMKLNGIGSVGGINLETGAVCITHLVNGTFSIKHVSRTSGEAKAYACNTYDIFRTYAYAIKKLLCFEKLSVASIVKPYIREDVPGEWTCVVAGSFSFIESFELTPAQILLKQLELNIEDTCTNLIRTETLVN